MNLSDWGVVADIVVSIGIIITLVYLAIQVHLNARQIKSQGLQASIANFLRNNQTFEGHDRSVSKRPIRDIQSSAKVASVRTHARSSVFGSSIVIWDSIRPGAA